MEKLLLKRGLYIGAAKAELELMQSLLNQNRINDLKLLIRTFGISVDMDERGLPSGNALQVIDAGSAQIKIKAGYALFSDYEFGGLEVDSNAMDITEGGTVYNVLISHAIQETELNATIAVNSGSNVVNGTNTKFTEYFRTGDDDKITISGSSEGNDGTYVVATVISDTQLTLSENIPGNTESDLTFAVGGRFAPGYPDGGNNYNIFEHDTLNISITTDPVGTNQFILATVANNAGVLTITDKRQENILQLRPLTLVDEPPPKCTNLIVSTGLDQSIGITADPKTQEQILTAWIKVSWGYTGTGTGGSGSWTDDTQDWTEEDVVGQYLYVEGQSYEITGVNVGGNTVYVNADLTGVSGSYVISPNAATYNIALILIKDDESEDKEHIRERRATFRSSPVLTTKTIHQLPQGKKYKVKIAALSWNGKTLGYIDAGTITTAEKTIAVPVTPVNVRITDISFATSDLVPDDFAFAKLPKKVRKGIVSNKARVGFAWNYQCEGTAETGETNDTFTPTPASGVSFGSDDLSDHTLYFKSKDYNILSNTSSVITIVGHFDTTGTDEGIVHSNADEYIINVTPVDAPTRKKERHVATPGSPVEMFYATDLELGVRYNFEVIARKGDTLSNVAQLTAGSYTKNGQVYSYDSPFQVVLPDISPDYDVGLDSTEYGFVATITGGTRATGWEYGYTTDNAGVNFDNDSHNIHITTERTIEVPTLNSRTYTFAARPLQGGQIVGEAVSKTVISGGGGNLPNDKTFPYIKVDIPAWTGQATYNDTTKELTVSTGDELPFADYNNRTIYDTSNHSAKITKTKDTTHIVVEAGSGFSESEADYKIGIVESDRHIFTFSVPNNIRITRLDFDCDIVDGTVKIRVYQYGNPDNAGFIQATTNDEFFSEPQNLIIDQKNGALKVVVDSWDPADGADNTKRIKGILTIHYRDLGVRYEEQITTLSGGINWPTL